MSPVILSLTTAAVSPTPDEPFPVVYTPLGDTDAMYFNNCDLATPGSPINKIFTSPRIFIPSGNCLQLIVIISYYKKLGKSQGIKYGILQHRIVLNKKQCSAKYTHMSEKYLSTICASLRMNVRTVLTLVSTLTHL